MDPGNDSRSSSWTGTESDPKLWPWLVGFMGCWASESQISFLTLTSDLELLHFFIHKLGVNDPLQGHHMQWQSVRKCPVYCLEYSTGMTFLLSKALCRKTLRSKCSPQLFSHLPLINPCQVRFPAIFTGFSKHQDYKKVIFAKHCQSLFYQLCWLGLIHSRMHPHNDFQELVKFNFRLGTEVSVTRGDAMLLAVQVKGPDHLFCGYLF